MDGVKLPQGYSHFEEAVYFLPFSSQKFLVLILSTSEGWKVESTLKPPSSFEHGNPGLGIQRLRAYLLLSSTILKRNSSVLISQKYSIGSWSGKLFSGGIPENGTFFTIIFSGSTSTHGTSCSFWLCCALLVLSSP